MTDETARPQYPHADSTSRVVRVFFDVYRELGHGFLEAVYQNALAVAFADGCVDARREQPVAVRFRGREVGSYKPGFIVEGHIVVELKAARALGPADQAQVLNYLRATQFEVGLLLNFGPRPTVRRFVHSAAYKRRPASA